jgi:anti-sigma regulatory factor (Ser/Thr protein kinase)
VDPRRAPDPPGHGDPTRTWASSAYRDPLAVAADFNEPLPDPPAGAARIGIGYRALVDVRRFVIEQAGLAGLDEADAARLAVAVNELASNTVEHGGGLGELAVWVQGDHLLCQLHDGGHLTDPLAGRIPVPHTGPDGGRGLLLVHPLCDLARIHTTPAGTTIRIHLAAKPAGAAASQGSSARR